MKNTSTKSNQKLKTIVISGDDKGGVGKSASVINVADALRKLGYRVALADGDQSNQTLTQLDPHAIQVDGRDEDSLDLFLSGVSSSDDDVTILDMPGSSGHVLTSYFGRRGFDVFTEMGLRIVVALTLTETDDSVQGVITWVETFADKAEFILWANHRDTPEGQPFLIQNLTAGDSLLELAEGRVINIPRFSPYMVAQYNKQKAAPSDYFVGGRAAKILNINAIQASLWRQHLQKVTASVFAQAEFLTGRVPSVIPTFLETEGANVASELASKFREIVTRKRNLGGE